MSSDSGERSAARSTELRYITRETAAYLYDAVFHDSSAVRAPRAA